MPLFIDTHILMWMLYEPKKLKHKIRQLLNTPGNQLYISIVSLWEITIKASLGKYDLDDDFLDQVYASDVIIIPIEPPHLLTLLTLPHHHRDPFDRLIIAQAIAKNLTLITNDPAFEPYDAKLITV